jgi:membrane dipeptidase
MCSDKLHQDAIIIDGLVISEWSREVFEDMQAGGLTAANCTCGVWEGFRDSMKNIATWKTWISSHTDILKQIYTTEDILRVKQEHKVGIILGWQNTWGFEDQIPFIQLFWELGIRCTQLTYNTQNLVGSGCWETYDGGLSDFGREVVDELNRVGMVIDLSHVGTKTSEDAIAYSKKRVAYTHVAPKGLFDHPRNKTDDQLKFLACHEGFIGVAIFPSFLPWQENTTVENCIEVIEYVIDRAGEDNVGIGTDFTQNRTSQWFDWLRHDKGYARQVVPGKGTAPHPIGFSTLKDYPKLTRAMEQKKWSETRIRKIMGENWLRFLKDVWGA